jgi:hypothetical protein
MLLKTAIRIIFHEKMKFLGALAGVSLAMFLVLLQWGFYFGYKRDTTVVLDALDADIWIVPKGQPTFDGFASIDDLAYWKAKDLPDVREAARVVWGVAPFRNPVNGTSQRVQILGVEFDSGIGPPEIARRGPGVLSATRRLHSRGQKEPSPTRGAREICRGGGDLRPPCRGRGLC